MKKPPRLTPEDVRRMFDYDPETGLLTWREPKQGRRIGRAVGTVGHNGYLHFFHADQTYMVHRLIWAWMTGREPTAQIDHINRSVADNRWSNLREATISQQQANTKRSTRNTSGQKGVDLHHGKWRARVKVNGKYISLGHFTCFEQAKAAYAQKAVEVFGQYART